MAACSVRDWFRCCLAAADSAADSAAGGQSGLSGRVGDFKLAAFQQQAVTRGLKIARLFGGVVLADAVGLGKTRVSLAIARPLVRDARLRAGSAATAEVGPVWICAPARLRRQWTQASMRAGVRDVEVISHTQLSRDAFAHAARPSVLVVDEAHRFRNPRANRSRALSRLCVQAPVILATATPVCNSHWDLYHLLDLFLADHDLRGALGYNLGEAFESAEDRAFDLSELAEQVVIRRIDPPPEPGFGRRPNVSLEVLHYDARGAEKWLWRRLEAELGRMTMELFCADWPRHLLVQYVLKRWESGADALSATLSKMGGFHRRWLEADDHGRTLSRQRFGELFDGERGRRQEVFPFVFDRTAEPSDGSAGPDMWDGNDAAGQRRERVEHDRSVLDALADYAHEAATHGNGKWGAVWELVQSEPGKLLIFTSYRHAAHGIYDYLVDRSDHRAKVGMVTGDCAQATGLGATTAGELIRRFAPASNGFEQVETHQTLDVLISTDCLAEGVNLQDCGRVVLADLPYSPLGVEQRIGRLVRPGGPHDQVTVYLPRPTSWTDSLGMRRRLGRKLAQAAGAGAAFVSAARMSDPDQSDGQKTGAPPASPLAALTRLDALARSLRGGDDHTKPDGFWRARVRRGPPRLWLRVRVDEPADDDQSRWLWCLARDGQPAQLRLAKLVDALVRDANHSGPIERAPPTPTLLESARRAVSRREQLLRAARLAPFPLRLDAPQRKLWAKICDWAERDALPLEAGRLSRLRANLLRAFPRGTTRRLDDLDEAQLSPRMLLERLRRVMGDLPKWSPSVALEIVGGLELSSGDVRR